MAKCRLDNFFFKLARNKPSRLWHLEVRISLGKFIWELGGRTPKSEKTQLQLSEQITPDPSSLCLLFSISGGISFQGCCDVIWEATVSFRCLVNVKWWKGAKVAIKLQFAWKYTSWIYEKNTLIQTQNHLCMISQRHVFEYLEFISTYFSHRH